jgi:multiple sugar transport system ATP-binding protein
MGQVSLRGVRKRFGDQEVITGIDLEIHDGEFLVLVGPSGCGKSTTLRMIAGLESISQGDLLIDGQRMNDVHPAARGAAMVFQSYALYPHMTVAENMGFALKMAGVKRAEREKQVQQAAQTLQITELLGRYPKDLSGGQRQRVAIGRAIVRKPSVFLFDEPLSNLDAALRTNMRIELSRLHRALGTTMVYVTHDQVEAMTMGDRIAVFNQGRIEQLGRPMDLYQRPANLFVAGFLGSPRINLVPRPDSTSTPEHAFLWQKSSSATPSAPAAASLGLRAEHLQVVPPEDGVIAEVVMAEHLGDSSLLHLRVRGLPDLLHARVPSGQEVAASGQAVGLSPMGVHALWFDEAGRRLAAEEAGR